MIAGIVAGGKPLISAPAVNYPTVGSVLTQSFNGTSHTISIPSVCAVGDLMFVQIIIDGSGTITTPAGWTRTINSGLVNGVNARTYLYYRIKDAGDAGTLVMTSTTSTRSAIIGWSIQTGTFNPAVNPTVAAAVGTSASPAPPTATNPSGLKPAIAIAIMCADVRPSVSVFPLPDNNTQMLSSATPGVSCAMCTQTTALSSFSPSAYTISASVEWLAGTIIVAGF